MDAIHVDVGLLN